LTRLLTVLTRGGRGLVRCTTWLSGPADVSPWTGCTGPRWTGHVPKRYGLILAARLDLTAPERVRVIPAAAPRLRRGRHGRRRAKLGGGRRGGDSGHPNRIRIHRNNLQALAKSVGYQNGNGEFVGVAFLVVAPWPVVRSSPIRRSRALFDEPKAWGAVGAHRESRRRGLRRLEGLRRAGRRRR